MMIAEREPDEADWIAFRLRLTPREAQIVSLLYRAGTWVEGEAIAIRVGMTIEQLRVHVFNIRKRYGQNAILCAYHVGYTLGSEGVEAVKRALA